MTIDDLLQLVHHDMTSFTVNTLNNDFIVAHRYIPLNFLPTNDHIDLLFPLSPDFLSFVVFSLSFSPPPRLLSRSLSLSIRFPIVLYLWIRTSAFFALLGKISKIWNVEFNIKLCVERSVCAVIHVRARSTSYCMNGFRFNRTLVEEFFFFCHSTFLVFTRGSGIVTGRQTYTFSHVFRFSIPIYEMKKKNLFLPSFDLCWIWHCFRFQFSLVAKLVIKTLQRSLSSSSRLLQKKISNHVLFLIVVTWTKVHFESVIESRNGELG